MKYLFSSKLVTIQLACLAIVMSGCSTNNLHKYSQAQITAMTTREVQASYSDTFKSATDALFDAGYTIDVSDRDGGILTGVQGKDRTMARVFVNEMINDTVLRVSVLLRKRTSRSTSVRLSTSKNAEPYIDEEAIDQFWRLMERQVLMTAAPPMERLE